MEDPLSGVLGRLDEQIKSGQRKKALRTVEEGDSNQLLECEKTKYRYDVF